MGQGLSQAGGAIGEMLMRGYAGLGEGLAKGINAAVGQYAQEMQAQRDQQRKLQIMEEQAGYQMQQSAIGAENQYNLAKMQEGAATGRTQMGAQTQFDIEQLRQKYRAQQGGGVNFSLDPFGYGGGGGGANDYNQNY